MHLCPSCFVGQGLAPAVREAGLYKREAERLPCGRCRRLKKIRRLLVPDKYVIIQCIETQA